MMHSRLRDTVLEGLYIHLQGLLLCGFRHRPQRFPLPLKYNMALSLQHDDASLRWNLVGEKVVQRYTKLFRKKIYTDMESCMLKLY